MLQVSCQSPRSTARNLLPGGMTLGKALGSARRAGHHLYAAFDRFIDVEGYRLAASLSFYALSSLLPLLLLAAAAADIVLGDSNEVRQSLIGVLDVTDSPSLRELILGALEDAQGAGERSNVGIVVGLLGAIFGASGIFLELDTALEKLFRVPPVSRTVRQHVKRFLLDRGAALLLVIATCLLLLFGVLVLSTLELLATKLRVPSDTWPGALTYLGTIGLFMAALTLCYRVVPAPRVHWRSAFAGALLATVGLTLTRLPLGWAITNLTSYATYGVVGTLLVLVTWFYAAGNILLLGGAMAAQVNHSRRYATPEDQRNHGQHQKHDEQDLGDARGARGETTEAEQRGNQSDHEKYGSPVQHDEFSVLRSSARAK
jgi:membrane protein